MSESPIAPANPPANAAPEEKALAALSELFADLADRRQRAFLAGFLAGKGLKRAEDLSDVSLMCHYQWMKNDEAYREHFRLTKTILTDGAEDEVYRRAFVGYDAPIVHAGKIIGSHKRYSDSLAQFMLKGMRPRVYRDGMDDLPMGPMSMEIRILSPEESEKERAEARARQAPDAPRIISIPGGDSDSAEVDEQQTFANLKEKP